MKNEKPSTKLEIERAIRCLEIELKATEEETERIKQAIDFARKTKTKHEKPSTKLEIEHTIECLKIELKANEEKSQRIKQEIETFEWFKGEIEEE